MNVQEFINKLENCDKKDTVYIKIGNELKKLEYIYCTYKNGEPITELVADDPIFI